ncbi:MAG: CHASE4 domain-containing protein [Candidatus Methylacidiphilales bacterium]|nr:CHASE4 domain-containing protein [Candidatus Methylacidiphilales bacterium]
MNPDKSPANESTAQSLPGQMARVPLATLNSNRFRWQTGLDLGIRLLLLALGFGGGCVLMLLVVHHHQTSQFLGVFQQQQQEEEIRLNAQIELTGQTLRNFVHDYSYWDEMVAFTLKPNPVWARENLDVTLDSFQLDAVWVMNPNCELVHSSVRENNLTLPLRRDELRACIAKGYFSHFFVWSPAGLMEIRVAPIQPSADSSRLSSPRGWLIGGRLWTAARMDELQKTSGLRLEITQPGAPFLAGDLSDSRIAFTSQLVNWEGQAIAEIQAQRFVPMLSGFARLASRTFWLTGAICFVLFSLLLAALHFSYNRPLQLLTAAALDPEVDVDLTRLLARSDEIGHLAAVVKSLREHHDRMAQEIRRREQAEYELKQAITEQDLFARELHDDILQTLYAMGMAIDAAERNKAVKPQEIRRLLSQIVPEINRAIAALRIAIAGLESRRTEPARLRQVLLRILDSTLGHCGVAVATQIDEAAISRLDRNQIFHLIRLIREVATNTAKHAKAGHFRLEIVPSADAIQIIAEDDGVGLPAHSAETGGSGLNNLMLRAEQMGARLAWETNQPSGLRVRIDIPTQPL